jgi:hypothetical protein
MGRQCSPGPALLFYRNLLRSERYREFAVQMVRLKVDVIIVSTTPAGFVVKVLRLHS